MSQNQVITLPNAPQNRPVICEYAGGHFKLSDKGITFIGTDKDGNQLPPRWICSPLSVVAKTLNIKKIIIKYICNIKNRIENGA